MKLYEKIFHNIDKVNGQDFNIGGGIENSLSLIECLNKLNILNPNSLKTNFQEARKGDQKVYISDISKVYTYLSWKPKINIDHGIKSIYSWLKDKKL